MTTAKNLPLLIEPEQLVAVLDDPQLTVIDLACKEQTYLVGHVPGAVYVPSSALISGKPPGVGMLPEPQQLDRLINYLGITEDNHVVVYDDEGGGWAGRMIWTLDIIGHKQYSYLNGGIHAWVDAGLETETTPRMPFSKPVRLDIDEQPRVTKQYLLDNLDSPELVIWDARSPGEYSGVKKNAARAGHIPGAVNYEWTRGMAQDRQLRIRDLEDIRQELAELGITSDKEIVTHCQTHHRSGFTYLLGKLLGFQNIRAYDGSWGEWGNDPDTPIATST